MPAFTYQSVDLKVNGPFLEVRFSLGLTAEQALRAHGLPSPPPVLATALIDTGAARTTVQQGLLDPLGVHPIGTVTIATPAATPLQCPEYLVRLAIPTGEWVQLPVLEAPLRWHGIQCLLGRDVLAHATLIYIGTANVFSIHF